MSNSTQNSPSDTAHYDVAVVGGGAAGLSAAVTLGRSLRSVVVIDSAQQRNLPADSAHNLLGREGIAPSDLVAAGRSEAASYGAVLLDDEVTDAHRADGGFALQLASGARVQARRILLATGLVDELPEIEGLAQGWGSTVLHCPYCHGWEVRGQRIGVIATGPMAEHQALLFGRLTDAVTVFDHSAILDDAARARLYAMGVAVVSGTVAQVDVEGDRVRAVLVDDSRYEVDAVVVGTAMHARADVYRLLGGEVTPHPMGSFIDADQMGRTAVDGVWAAGNVRDLSAMVGMSAGMGVFAGAGLNADLVADEVAAAMSVRS
ncbi:NAD(P)/FAD-dependent oxidoreductase [Gordonia hydrophobica]|uniref:NAD(P)/FAD-dependent oxidoreductase n=1 Tax=Gordonia hydrophobica TaxID=40516 RepID=A0ABZ2U0Z8_9ACTN|nr:NAD(P)/FAD-dependent oxidoreductase [Gordonia hydrophobica]MBM7369149.1 thioredoxin reductase [Gordonia hydrophobica]